MSWPTRYSTTALGDLIDVAESGDPAEHETLQG
jgi:hypothetical protein